MENARLIPKPSLQCVRLNVKPGIGQAARLDEVGFGNTELGVRRLKSPVIQQRDLNGVIHAKWLRQQFLRTLESSDAVFVVFQVDGVLTKSLGRSRRYGVESAVL